MIPFCIYVNFHWVMKFMKYFSSMLLKKNGRLFFSVDFLKLFIKNVTFKLNNLFLFVVLGIQHQYLHCDPKKSTFKEYKSRDMLINFFDDGFVV
jgi:hypothetical protein